MKVLNLRAFSDTVRRKSPGWLKKYGAEAMGAHIPIEEICDDTDNMIAFHKAIGNHRIICPWSEIKTAAIQKR